MSKFVQWYRAYDNEITWWVIGWLSFNLLDCILKNNWVLAVVSGILIFINYKLWKNNNA